jgi:hypothetical protein
VWRGPTLQEKKWETNVLSHVGRHLGEPPKKKKKKKEKEEDALLLNKIERKPSWATLIQKESNADLSFRQWIGVTKTERKARNVKCSRQPKD